MHGLAPAALSPLSVEHDCGPGLLLSFTNVPQERACHVAGALLHAIGNRLDVTSAGLSSWRSRPSPPLSATSAGHQK